MKMKIYMYPNLVKPNSRKYTEQACAVLISEGAQICMEEEYREIFGELYEIEYLSQTECVEKCDVIVVTGGYTALFVGRFKIRQTDTRHKLRNARLYGFA